MTSTARLFSGPWQSSGPKVCLILQRFSLKISSLSFLARIFLFIFNFIKKTEKKIIKTETNFFYNFSFNDDRGLKGRRVKRTDRFYLASMATEPDDPGRSATPSDNESKTSNDTVVARKVPNNKEWVASLSKKEKEYFEANLKSSEELEDLEVRCTSCWEQVNHKVEVSQRANCPKCLPVHCVTLHAFFSCSGRCGPSPHLGRTHLQEVPQVLRQWHLEP
jgi:hypothetical protein